MIQIFKYIIDIWFIPIDAIFNMTYTWDDNVIHVGTLICGSIIGFRTIWMVLECLGILEYLYSKIGDDDE